MPSDINRGEFGDEPVGMMLAGRRSSARSQPELRAPAGPAYTGGPDSEPQQPEMELRGRRRDAGTNVRNEPGAVFETMADEPTANTPFQQTDPPEESMLDKVDSKLNLGEISDVASIASVVVGVLP